MTACCCDSFVTNLVLIVAGFCFVCFCVVILGGILGAIVNGAQIVGSILVDVIRGRARG